MCTSQSGCSKDYSLLTANTGIATPATNPALDGTGNSTTVLTAGANGTIIRSVIIKATEPITTGMVRLFIRNNTDTVLYKEVPVQVTPVLTNTPTPTPVLPMYEVTLNGDLKLENGHSLKVTTQVDNSFVVIAEGLDWAYPSTLPNDCCNYKQTSAVTGLGILATANPNLDGSGTIVPVFTAGSGINGSFIKNITIKALGSTSINGMIRLFISNDGGSTYKLMREIEVPQTTQSAYEPSWKQVVAMEYNVKAGIIIGASTQNAEKFGVTVEAEEWSYPI
jgi:hypothetical protein